MRSVINLVVIIAVGVIIADLVTPGHIPGTTAVLKGSSNLWTIGVNGLLGTPTTRSMTV